MQFKISNNEIQSLLADRKINVYFQPSGIRVARIGISAFLSIPVDISINGKILELQYTSGIITGRVVNFIISLLRARFGSIVLDLNNPGVVGVDLTSIPNADKVFEFVDISDLFFESDTLVIKGSLK